jgi:nicotinamide mononucleotide adenylyltransferase
MDVGVVIGRFQVHELTDGHLFLINSALANHRRVLVLVGSPQEYSTKKNPLDYPTRERMIRSRFPDVVVQAAPDFPNNDKRWSHHIDVTIAQCSTPAVNRSSRIMSARGPSSSSTRVSNSSAARRSAKTSAKSSSTPPIFDAGSSTPRKTRGRPKSKKPRSPQ